MVSAMIRFPPLGYFLEFIENNAIKIGYSVCEVGVTPPGDLSASGDAVTESVRKCSECG